MRKFECLFGVLLLLLLLLCVLGFEGVGVVVLCSSSGLLLFCEMLFFKLFW